MNKKFAKILAKNFIYLGHGGARIVFAINNELVMKVPKNNFGIRQNETEFLIYKNAGYFRKYLCPVISYSSNILVMAKAEPLEDDYEYLDSLRCFCDDLDFYKDILVFSRIFKLYKNDIRATSSWGIFNNQKVLIDYGYKGSGKI